MKKSVLFLMLLLEFFCFVICFASQTEDQYRHELNIRANNLRNTIVNNSRQLLLKEIEVAENIDETRYKGLETELPPVYPEILQDVIELLDWALRLERDEKLEPDANLHFLLGWVYYLRHDLGEFCDEKSVGEAKNHLRQAKMAYTKNSSTLSQNDYQRLMDMMRELDNVPPGSCREGIKAIQDEEE